MTRLITLPYSIKLLTEDSKTVLSLSQLSFPVKWDISITPTRGDVIGRAELEINVLPKINK